MEQSSPREKVSLGPEGRTTEGWDEKGHYIKRDPSVQKNSFKPLTFPLADKFAKLTFDKKK